MQQNKANKSAADILGKARRYCALQERSKVELAGKLTLWGASESEIPGILHTLSDENYLSEERFAKAYARGKFRINQWGRLKIKEGLNMHGITETMQKTALKEINESDYISCLENIVLRKKAILKEKDKDQEKNKLIEFAYSKGFERELTRQVIKKDPGV